MSKTNLELVFKKDPTGLPMVWIEEIPAWMHWLPMTKVQFEVFLADQTDRYFSAKVYRQILERNPRIDLQQIDTGNYWQAFLTGVLPHEAEAFANWCGASYRLPKIDEWLRAFHYLETPEARAIDWAQELRGVPARRRELVEQLDRTVLQLPDAAYGDRSKRSLADQMFMRLGVVEWIRDAEEPPNWGGLGEPHSSFAGQLSSLDLADPIEPRNPESQRVDYFGVRLICTDGGPVAGDAR